jgi:hypothetical protein
MKEGESFDCVAYDDLNAFNINHMEYGSSNFTVQLMVIPLTLIPH